MDLLWHLLAFARPVPRRVLVGCRSTALHLGLGLGQACTLLRHRSQDALGQVLDDMEETTLRQHRPTDLADRRGIERRTIGCDPLEHHIALRQDGLEAPQKRGDVVLSGIVLQDCLQHPFILPILDD